MIGSIFAVLAILGLPVLCMYATQKVKFFKAIGAIAMCYFIGIIFSLINFNGGFYDKGLTETIAYVLVAIALPLILFGFSLKSAKKLAKKTAISFGLVCLSVIVVSTAAFFIVSAVAPDLAAYICAMAIGLYTGGTPNLIAIGSSIGAGIDVINYANLSDVIIGGVYFLCLITFVPKLYSKILDKKTTHSFEQQSTVDDSFNEEDEGFVGEYKESQTTLFSLVKNKHTIKGLILVLLLAIGCVGFGVGLSLLFGIKFSDSLFILILLITVSVLGIAFSFIPKVRTVKGSYKLGQYFVLMFSLSLAMSLSYDKVHQILTIMIVMLCIMLCSIFLHILLCKLFKIDSKTAIITSVAGVYGPPFIQPVAEASKVEEMIVPGVICGVIGLALGTFLGVGIGWLYLLI